MRRELYGPDLSAELAKTHTGSPLLDTLRGINGATDPLQLVTRPRIAVDPYATGRPGTFLCSASTPPGAGVHGMCGHQAATRALTWLDH